MAEEEHNYACKCVILNASHLVGVLVQLKDVLIPTLCQSPLDAEIPSWTLGMCREPCIITYCTDTIDLPPEMRELYVVEHQHS